MIKFNITVFIHFTHISLIEGRTKEPRYTIHRVGDTTMTRRKVYRVRYTIFLLIRNDESYLRNRGGILEKEERF